MVIVKQAPVYLLAGSEQLLRQRELARLKAAHLDRASGEFNFNLFFAGCDPVQKALESALTLPFLGSKRVVLLRLVENLSSEEQDCILSYLKAPSSQTILILETEKDDLREPFLNKLSSLSKIISCRPLEERETLGWIKQEAKARGKFIEDEAVRILVNNLGRDLGLLSNALEAAILYIGARATIKAQDVAKLVGPDIKKSAFELFDAVVKHERKKSFGILDGLLKQGVSSAQILGALFYRLIARRSRIASGALDQALACFQETDRNIKSGRQTQRMALEILVVKLLGLV